MRARLNGYTSYSVGCAAVWAVILFIAQRQTDTEMRKTMQRFCVAWWSGWTSATIARVVYPAPKKLGPRADETLQIASVVLIALGASSVIRFFWAARSRLKPGSSGCAGTVEDGAPIPTGSPGTHDSR